MNIAANRPATARQLCPVPLNEHARLQALAEIGILDTPAEAAFEAVARIAASTCAAPIALVSIVGRDRQKLKACLGMPAQELPREATFCAHAILDRKLFEVRDALRDPRFADNPLVTGEPGIRFYAGMPLITSDGLALGTLCVLDRVPRSLNANQRKSLEDLASLVVANLETRKAVAEASQLGTILNEVFEEIIVLYPGSQHIQYANDKVLSSLGYTLDELQRTTIAGIGTGYPYDKLRALGCARDSRRREPIAFEATHTRKDGSVYPVEVHATVSSSQVEPQLIFLANDISKRKQTEALLRRHADYDATTGLPNRQSLVRLLEAAMQRVRREHTRLALVMIEIEHLTDIRHSYGEHVACMVLADFGRRLQGCATAINPVAHMGGDEFAILVEPVADDAYVSRLVRGIQKNLERCFTWSQSQIMLSASIGAVYFEGGADTAAHLIERSAAAVNIAFLNGAHEYIAVPTRKAPAPDASSHTPVRTPGLGSR